MVMVLANAPLRPWNGTYHRDVKPANVLLTLQHGPQLFDFNLAESPHSAHHAREAIHGGTLPYVPSKSRLSSTPSSGVRSECKRTFTRSAWYYASC